MLKFFFPFNYLFDEGNEAAKIFLLEKLMAQESLPCLPVNWLRFSLYFVRVNREEVLEARVSDMERGRPAGLKKKEDIYSS